MKTTTIYSWMDSKSPLGCVWLDDEDRENGNKRNYF